MITLAKYSTIIPETDLISLTSIDELIAFDDLTPTQEAAFTAEVDHAETQAQAIITQQFGATPANTNFLETCTMAGVVYLLSRKPKNKISRDDLDTRRQHFFDLLPGSAGSVSQAEWKSAPTKLGEWI